MALVFLSKNIQQCIVEINLTAGEIKNPNTIPADKEIHAYMICYPFGTGDLVARLKRAEKKGDNHIFHSKNFFPRSSHQTFPNLQSVIDALGGSDLQQPISPDKLEAFNEFPYLRKILQTLSAEYPNWWQDIVEIRKNKGYYITTNIDNQVKTNNSPFLRRINVSPDKIGPDCLISPQTIVNEETIAEPLNKLLTTTINILKGLVEKETPKKMLPMHAQAVIHVPLNMNQYEQGNIYNAANIAIQYGGGNNNVLLQPPAVVPRFKIPNSVVAMRQLQPIKQEAPGPAQAPPQTFMIFKELSDIAWIDKENDTYRPVIPISTSLEDVLLRIIAVINDLTNKTQQSSNENENSAAKLASTQKCQKITSELETIYDRNETQGQAEIAFTKKALLSILTPAWDINKPSTTVQLTISTGISAIRVPAIVIVEKKAADFPEHKPAVLAVIMPFFNTAANPARMKRWIAILTPHIEKKIGLITETTITIYLSLPKITNLTISANLNNSIFVDVGKENNPLLLPVQEGVVPAAGIGMRLFDQQQVLRQQRANWVLPAIEPAAHVKPPQKKQQRQNNNANVMPMLPYNQGNQVNQTIKIRQLETQLRRTQTALEEIKKREVQAQINPSITLENAYEGLQRAYGGFIDEIINRLSNSDDNDPDNHIHIIQELQKDSSQIEIENQSEISDPLLQHAFDRLIWLKQFFTVLSQHHDASDNALFASCMTIFNNATFNIDNQYAVEIKNKLEGCLLLMTQRFNEIEQSIKNTLIDCVSSLQQDKGPQLRQLMSALLVKKISLIDIKTTGIQRKSLLAFEKKLLEKALKDAQAKVDKQREFSLSVYREQNQTLNDTAEVAHDMHSLTLSMLIKFAKILPELKKSASVDMRGELDTIYDYMQQLKRQQRETETKLLPHADRSPLPPTPQISQTFLPNEDDDEMQEYLDDIQLQQMFGEGLNDDPENREEEVNQEQTLKREQAEIQRDEEELDKSPQKKQKHR